MRVVPGAKGLEEVGITIKWLEARAPSFVDALPAFLELFAAPSLPRRDLEAVKRDLTVVDDEQHVADVANIDERTAVERQRGLLRNLLV